MSDLDLRHFLLVTEPNGEFRARDHLERLGFQPYVPSETVKRQRAVRTMFGTQHRPYQQEQPIFRGYLLLPLNMAWSFGPLYTTPGLRSKPFLQIAGQPVTMSAVEVELLRKIEHALANPEKPVLPFNVGDRVKIVDGPFIDQVGTIKRLDNEARIEILLQGLGKAFLHAYQVVKDTVPAE